MLSSVTVRKGTTEDTKDTEDSSMLSSVTFRKGTTEDTKDTEENSSMLFPP